MFCLLLYLTSTLLTIYPYILVLIGILIIIFNKGFIMNKSELIDSICEKLPSSATKKEVSACLDAFVATITETLKLKEEIKIPGFGRLFVKNQPARSGRNPSSGQPMDFPAKDVVKFSPASALKDAAAAELA